MARTPKPPALPDTEVQALADLALKAWESGVEHVHIDTLLGQWTFLQLRDPEAGLSLSRVTQAGTPDERTVASWVSGRELGGHDHVRVLLASRVLALAAPP